MFHKHKWVEVDRQTWYEPEWFGGRQWRDMPKTRISQRCVDCQKYRQYCLDGVLKLVAED